MKQNLITGISEVDQHLVDLDNRVRRQIVRVSTNQALTIVAKAIRNAIDSEPGISPQMKKALKWLIGKRFKKQKRSDEVTAKAGFGVGAAGKRRTPKRSGKNKGGVGLSAVNVHWFALGTQPRRNKRGNYRGFVSAIRVVSRAYAASGQTAADTMKRVALERIDQAVRDLASKSTGV